MTPHDIAVANYADDNTSYCTSLKIQNVLIKLENAAETMLKWFNDKIMKTNPGKYHLLINDNKENFQIKIGNETVSNSNYEKLLGVKVDHELNFNKLIIMSHCCARRLASCTIFDQRRLISNSFMTSHFSSCSVVWMFHSRKINERINYIHERALGIVYKDFKS